MKVKFFKFSLLFWHSDPSTLQNWKLVETTTNFGKAWYELPLQKDPSAARNICTTSVCVVWVPHTIMFPASLCRKAGDWHRAEKKATWSQRHRSKQCSQRSVSVQRRKGDDSRVRERFSEVSWLKIPWEILASSFPTLSPPLDSSLGPLPRKSSMSKRNLHPV